MTDYNFLDDSDSGSLKPPVSPGSETDRSSEPEIELSEFDQILITAGRVLGVLSLSTGVVNSILQQAAQGQAALQAEFAEMGHQLWQSRSKLLAETLPEYTGFREVCAYSGYHSPQVAKNLFESWSKSKAHWVWVNGRCDIWGYSMAFSKTSNLWYACGIFADRRST